MMSETIWLGGDRLRYNFISLTAFRSIHKTRLTHKVFAHRGKVAIL